MKRELTLPVTTRNAGNVKVFKSLFVDVIKKEDLADNAYTVFTLKDRDDVEVDGKVYYSLYKLYVELTEGDPTEYLFAMTVFGSCDYWEDLATKSYVAPFVSEWRKEKDQRIKAFVVADMLRQVRDGKASYGVLKYLADNGYIPANTKKVGRPKKVEDEPYKLESPIRLEDEKRFEEILGRRKGLN